MKPVRVLIHEPYPFSQIAGNLQTQSYILDMVDRERFQLVLLAPFETDFTKMMRERGIDTVILEPPNRVNRYGGKCLKDGCIGKILTVICLLRYNMKLRALFREKQIDVVYCNCIRSVLTVGMAARSKQIPIFWYIKAELQNPLLDTIGFFLSNRVFYFCDANKNDKYPLLTSMFRKKIGILQIGIDLGKFAEIEKSKRSLLTKELHINREKKNCVYLGQVYPPKGIHYLLEALALVKDEYPNIRLYIVGDHIIDEYRDYKNKLMQIIERHSMGENVVFTGWRRDALHIASLMDILIHPSLSEAFGIAVLEGMALGKPVIATKVGGLRELVRDGVNGFLVEPGNPRMIAERLSLLIRDRNLRERMGKAARDTVFSEYAIENRIKELEHIWSDMSLNTPV